MENIKLVVAYDGGSFLGWQKTDRGPTIEASLQAVIEQIVQHPVSLQAASRTDAGVHARGQVINFFTPLPNIPLEKLKMSMNRLLPKEIVIISIERMPNSFHPTLDCISKEYRYFVCYGPIQLPHRCSTSWHVHYDLDLTLIREALPYLIGTHGFEAFCNRHANSRYPHYNREIHLIDFVELEERHLCFRVIGHHFLYKMVRNLIGTLIFAGRGKILPCSIPEILLSRNRVNAGITAPAHGLFLHAINYDTN